MSSKGQARASARISEALYGSAEALASVHRCQAAGVMTGKMACRAPQPGADR